MTTSSCSHSCKSTAPAVLNVPREMNGLALIVLLAILTATASVVIVFVRKRRLRRAMLTTTAAEVDALSRVREKAEHGDA